MYARVTTQPYGDFNPRPRKEGDMSIKARTLGVYKISIHALAKRATQIFPIVRPRQKISIHALAKRATGMLTVTNFINGISIHALAKRATLCLQPLPVTNKFQSTPSQRGRLIILPTVNVPLIISIHALAKRATSLLKCTTQAFVISIHALAKRATKNINFK